MTHSQLDSPEGFSAFERCIAAEPRDWHALEPVVEPDEFLSGMRVSLPDPEIPMKTRSPSFYRTAPQGMPHEEGKMVYVVPFPEYIEPERQKAEEEGVSFDKDCVYVALNPAFENFGGSPHFADTFKKDFGVEVDAISMPVTIIDDQGQVLNQELNSFNNQSHDTLEDLLSREQVINLGGWQAYRMTGEAKKLNDPHFIEGVGALVAREVGRPEQPLYLEDATCDKPKVLSIASKDSNLADQITDEYKFLSLDEIITEEMKCVEKGKEPSKARITVHALGHKVVQALNIQIPQRPVYH